MAKANEQPKEKNEVVAQMDADAVIAAEDLKTCKTAEDVAKWMKKHYMKAGYKRLSRELMKFYKL